MQVAIALALLSIVGAQASAEASPSPSAVPAKQTLQIDIPPSWKRMQSGRYNVWQSPDGTANFRVSVVGVSDDIRGPDAAGAVKARFEKSIASVRPNANVHVTAELVCDHTQPAYRIDDPLGVGSAGFMLLIPGTQSSGLINYEIPRGGHADPAILAAIAKLCWP